MDDKTSSRPPAEPDTPPRPEAGARESPFAAYRPRRHRHWDVLLAIALGGGLGSLARYLVGDALPTAPGQFPWSTFLINISGGFALGWLMVMILDVWPPTRYVRPFLGIGVLGGFTTFSTLAVELRGLAANGHLVLAGTYALATLAAGLAAVWTGTALGRLLTGQPVRRVAHRREGRTR
jgi:CrcB protein